MSILHKPNRVVCFIIMPEGTENFHSDERNIQQLCCNQNAKKKIHSSDVANNVNHRSRFVWVEQTVHSPHRTFKRKL